MTTQTRQPSGADIIREFEGFEAAAYEDPLHGGKVPTIGYGTTRYSDGTPVKMGDTITKEKALEELRHHLETIVRPALKRIPHFDEMHPKMVAALESFAYNLGAGFYGGDDFETITRKLKDREWADMRAAFVLYRNPGTRVEAGLLRRREREADLWEEGLKALGTAPRVEPPSQNGRFGIDKFVDFFHYFRRDNPNHVRAAHLLAAHLPPEVLSDDADWVVTYRMRPAGETARPNRPAAAPSGQEIRLDVPYYPQLDSDTGHGPRMCFSSSCAMLLSHLKPGTLQGANGDDQYLRKLMSLGGDSTDAGWQLKTLASYGVKASFHQDMDWTDLDEQLEAGIPVPIGILHHGPASRPTGFGHWILVIGRTADGSGWIVHDPYGDLDLVNGGYPGRNSGKGLTYSKKNLGPRWMVTGTGSGWGIRAIR